MCLETDKSDAALGHICPPSVVKWLNSPVRKLLQNPQKIMGKYVNPGSTALDLGCGGGFFTLALAQMVGENGRVIAVDLQKEMLDITRRYVTPKGVLNRITFHQCKADELGLTGEKADFALAFFMVHELPNRRAFFKQVAEIIKPDGYFLIVEPKHHVTGSQFEQILEEVSQTGFIKVDTVRLFLSRGRFLQKSH